MDTDIHLIDWLKEHSTGELGYVTLIVMLFVLPRLLLRFGLPMALTSFTLGILANFTLGFYDSDRVIPMFSTLGIISLFIFAGIEVDIGSLKKAAKSIFGHLSIRILVISALAYFFSQFFNLNLAPMIILALAVSTPSTGFILDSVETSGISENQKYWIKLKAISAEIVALGILLVISQMSSTVNLIGSLLIIGTLILLLPILLKKLAGTLERLAPGSEFGFILLLGIISGIITKKLGAYYLVGAFIVGIVAGQYQRKSPSVSAKNLLHTLRSFSAFFMPFYFFKSGLTMPSEAFSIEALKVTVILAFISIPLKISSILFHRRITQNESWSDTISITVSLLPNLVFGLVLADILYEKMKLPTDIYGGLIIYTLLITILSPLLLKFIPTSKDLSLKVISTDPLDFTDLSNTFTNQPNKKIEPL